MNKFFLLSIICFPISLNAQHGKFIIAGRADKVMAGTSVYLTTVIDDEMTIDSAQVQNNTFKFEGEVDGAVKAFLSVSNSSAENKIPTLIQYRNNLRTFILEPGEIKVYWKGKLKDAAVSSTLNNHQKAYNELLKGTLKSINKLEFKLLALRSDTSSPDEQKVRDLTIQYQVSLGVKKMLQQKFIGENPKNFYSLLALEEVAGLSYDPVTINSMFESLDSVIKKSQEGKLFKMELDRGMNLLIGSEAPDFSVQDLYTGNSVRLSDFRGKYVLLDFWATYNDYCRKAHQTMLSAYREYADSNFTILSITVDPPADKDLILKAIKEDQMSWTNIGDPYRQRNDAAKMYNIFTLPQIYLIDNQGHIFNKNFQVDSLKSEIVKMRQATLVSESVNQ